MHDGATPLSRVVQQEADVMQALLESDTIDVNQPMHDGNLTATNIVTALPNSSPWGTVIHCPMEMLVD
jgi:hypothetical protein